MLIPLFHAMHIANDFIKRLVKGAYPYTKIHHTLSVAVSPSICHLLKHTKQTNSIHIPSFTIIKTGLSLPKSQNLKKNTPHYSKFIKIQSPAR
jgi:hypothetical protein